MDRESLIGTLFAGRFHIEALIDSGGMGNVYLAQHDVLQRKFAIKVIQRGLLADLKAMAMFRREARAASRIEHPNITYVFDFGHSDEGRPYIAMEYVEGPSLADVLSREGAFPLPRAIHIISQIAEALVAAHASKVVHRDLKPSNIVLTTHRDQPDYVKILDFGLAKIIGMETARGPTIAGSAFGTPDYMSPEQCLGEGIDHRTDIYSFGIIVFELLVGQVPFSGEDGFAVQNEHIHRAPPAPSEACNRDDIPIAVDNMVLRCLAKDPADRYANAAVLLSQIQSIRDSIGISYPIKSMRSSRLRLERNMAEVRDRPAIPPTLIPQTAPLTSRGSTEKQPEPHREATEKDWPEMPDTELRIERTRALEELACAVRDRGIGSSEISHVLGLKIETEERILDLEADIALIEANASEMETRAREREARLRQALNQMAHERTMLPPSPDGVDKKETLPWGSRVAAIGNGMPGSQIDERLYEITSKIQRISSQLEKDLTDLLDQRDQKQHALIGYYDELERHEDRLAHLLLDTRAQVVALGDSELERLFPLAGL